MSRLQPSEPDPDWLEKWQGMVRTEDDLVRFVDDVGFCTIGRLEQYPAFPSQEVAMGRPDVLGATWFWKDDLHSAKRLYYTRLFACKPGYISLDFLPAFIAANGEAMDELALFGLVSVQAQDIYSIIDERGPIAIKNLKALLGSETRRSASGILIDLERRFIITKTGITGRERGTYGYIWDLAERWMPDAFAAADRIGQSHAIGQIVDRLAALGVPPDAAAAKRLLNWPEGRLRP